MRNSPGVRAFGAALLIAGASLADPVSTESEPTSLRPSGVPEIVQLDNGLRVILVPNGDAPVVSACTAFDAGVRRDPADAPGVGRVVAELLRDGGRPTDRQDWGALLARRGGSTEMEFGHDAVTYCTTVPASELEFALWFEAGRFSTAAGSGAGVFTREAHERVVEALSADFERQDADAAGRANRRLRALAFQGRAAYARAPLATSAELEEVELTRLRSFHRDHYGASHAVVALVGDFEPGPVRVSLERHLGGLTQGAALPAFHLEWPHQTTERFSLIEDAATKTPWVWYGWVLPPAGEQREALELVAFALTSSTRLGASIVGPRKVAQSIETHLAGEAGPQLLSIRAVGTTAASLEHIQRAIDAELNKIGQFGLRPEEFVAARAARRRVRAAELASNLGQARALSRGALLGLDPEHLLTQLDPHADPEVSNVALARAVREYLHARRRTVVEIYPKGWGDPWQTPMPTYHLVSAGENLTRIAAMHGTTVAVIAKMNGLDPKKPIFPGQSLKVPRSRAANVKSVVHTVRAGDTLTAIARRYNVTVQSLADANGIDPKRPIRPGDELRIPSAKAGSSSQSGTSGKGTTSRTHKVRSGETLGGIARRYGVSVRELAAANGLGSKTTIRIGQTLNIPAATTSAGSPSSKQGSPAAPRKHVVRAGETLSGIAKKYGVTVARIAQANGINQKKPIRIGQTLVIPR